MMDAYDPLTPPSIADWIELDESERLDLVLAYHRRQGDDLPSPDVHAVAHVIVENQVALADETPVASVMERLMLEGLDRHEAIHAIGYVLMGALHGAAQGDNEADPTSAYYRELMQLTAKKWLNQEL
ncbi:MAG: hypothetical protein OEU92_25585 [Alphaproteobacteria bacterium]|nr:hypothetical protein [Alphaproteobacteria bacterium]